LFQVKPSQALRIVSSQAKPSSAGCFKSSLNIDINSMHFKQYKTNLLHLKCN
jgi:putative lipoic acid-binding regulatory protein